MIHDFQLRGLFREEREADEALAPAFERFRRASLPIGTSRRPRIHRIAVPMAAALAVALALLLRPRDSEKPPRGDVAVGADSLTPEKWTAPTDFLLQTPGRELLGSTPMIGAGVPNFSGVGSSAGSKGKQS